MNQYFIIEKTDDHEIVAGVGRVSVDPVETKKRLIGKIEQAAEYKTHERLKQKYVNLLKASAEKIRKLAINLQNKERSARIEETQEYKDFLAVRAGYNPQDPKSVAAYAEAFRKLQVKKKEFNIATKIIRLELLETSEYTAWLALTEEAKTKTSESWRAVLGARKRIAEENTVYFAPKGGLAVIDAQEAAGIRETLKTLPEKTLLLKTGEEIVDRRRDVYFFYAQNKWERAAVEKLGEELPQTAIFETDLTDEMKQQIVEENEAARLDELSQEEKQAEFDRLAQLALQAAAFKKIELEIAGETSEAALEQSQLWYQEQLSQLRTKYNIEE